MIFAGLCRTECRQVMQVKSDIMGHEEIGVTIAIVIAESNTRRPPYVLVEMGRLRDVGKGPIPVVAIKYDPAKAAHQQIRSAIVVVIADGYAHRPTWRGHAGPVRNVRKRSVMVVVIQRAAGLLSFQLHGNTRRTCKVDVKPAISVVVNQRHTTAHRLYDKFLFRAGKVLEMDAGRFCNVNKLRDRQRLLDPPLRHSLAIGQRCGSNKDRGDPEHTGTTQTASRLSPHT